MAKKMLIDATHAEETRVVVVDGNKVEEFDFESENKRQLAGNIYLAKVTRVEPSLQAAFVDYGGNRHGFLAFSEIHPDYYQIPVADRKALMEEEAALAAAAEEEEDKPKRSTRSRSRKKPASKTQSSDTSDQNQPDASPQDTAREPSGMETIDLSDDAETGTDAGAPGEGLSPMERVAETPVGEPVDSIESDGNPEPSTAEGASAVSGTEAAPVQADEASLQSAPVSEPAVTVATPEPTQAEALPSIGVSAEDTPPSAEAVPADAAPVQPVDGPAAEASEHQETASDEDDDDSSPSRPMAANSDDDAHVVTSEPGETQSDDDGDDDETVNADASSRDENIENVADDDTHEDIRPVRKPRPRRYKIQEVIKVRQIMLVQVVKEERGNKGAALTTYLSLAGRYCVLMPNTARGGGISRKITNAADRSKLKAIANEIDVPKGAGLIIRTAGAKRTKTEIKRDYEYLQRLWEQIRELTLKSIAPAKIYEEGDLIKRSIRDLYSREIDEVLVEGERGYRVAKDFMKMIMPSHAKNVKHYVEPMPLFARHQVESYLGGMFNPTVQLKSGGYIVIGVTEALVAIDVNSGRATKEGSIEDTATKTNLEAAEEVARQLRLRDLAGLIVIDFIDMDERKNNAAVEKKLKDKLKTDRARIQVGRISGFGLLEMSRQRLRPGMIEATTQPCSACHGTGLIRSDDNMALQILRQIEEEGVRRRSREVLVKCPVGIANYLMNAKREHIAVIEARYGMAVRIEGDPHLIAPDFSMEKFKTATRAVPEASAPVVSADTSIMDAIDEAAEAEDVVDDVQEVEEAEEAPAAQTKADTNRPEQHDESDDKPKKKRRRRRRRSKSKDNEQNGDSSDAGDQSSDDKSNDDDWDVSNHKPTPKGEAQDTSDESSAASDGAADAETPKKPTRSRSRSRSRSKPKSPDSSDQALTESAQSAADVKAEAQPEKAQAAPVAAPEPVAAPAEPAVASPEKPAVAAEPEPAPTPAPAPVVEPEPAVAEASAQETASDDSGEKARPARTRVKASDVIAQYAATDPAPEAVAEAPETPADVTDTPKVDAPSDAAPAPTADAAPEDDTEAAPEKKRRGWWSLGR
ncbi:Rne/Rng family ribonuclease [Sagittula sp. NFXS13]|uniref:Rne/Rng family ribonuclease n=1 Tax=Sagittula sp. NFXS13 TaxID=2819095 RepID=UPI0032DE893E